MVINNLLSFDVRNRIQDVQRETAHKTTYSRQRLYPTLLGGETLSNDITFQPKLKYDFPLSNILIKMVVS